MDVIQNTLNNLNTQLLEVLSNPYVQSLLLIFFIFYAGLAAPSLPAGLAKLFDFSIFKILILAMILYVNSFSPTVAIMVAVGFFISLQTLSRYKMFNLAEQMEKVRSMLGQKEKDVEEDVKDEKESEDDDHQNVLYDTADTMNGNYGLNMDNQVSGLASRTSDYQGPQGMKMPVGYGGRVEGADFL